MPSHLLAAGLPANLCPTPEMEAGLALLLEANDYAELANRPAWDFAVGRFECCVPYTSAAAFPRPNR